MKTNTSLSLEEIQKFEQMADDWWNPTGQFKPLHDLTPMRMEYIVNTAKKHFVINNLKDLNVLDIGCGGGLVAEPMARLGCRVTAIDASSININIAKSHATKSNLEINYQQLLAEDLLKTGKKYQLILALEVVEHVENVEFFVQTCCQLLEVGWVLIFSTINQTIKSFFKTIIAAEYILRWLPIGTHSWSKFVKPSVICKYAASAKGQLLDLQGFSYSPLSKTWNLSSDVSSNYFIVFKSEVTEN